MVSLIVCGHRRPSDALRASAGGCVTNIDTTGTALLYSALINETPEGLTLNSSGAAISWAGRWLIFPRSHSTTLSVDNQFDDGRVITGLTPDGQPEISSPPLRQRREMPQ
jgi:hypothetical protein